MSGWLVVVSTPRMGGGTPAREMFAVNEPDPVAAENLIRARTTSDETVDAIQTLGAQVFDHLGIPKGQHAPLILG